jgi:uncharacterized protein (DUF1778 family)
MKQPIDEKCTARIGFRCTPELKNAIDRAAKKDRRKPSQWIILQLETILEISNEDAIVSRSPLVLREVRRKKPRPAPSSQPARNA